MRGKEQISRLISATVLAVTVGTCRPETNTPAPSLEPNNTPTPIATPNIFQNQESGLEPIVSTLTQEESTQSAILTPHLAPTREDIVVPPPVPTREPIKVVDQFDFLGINFRDGLETKMTIETKNEQEIVINFYPRAYENNGQDVVGFCAPGQDVCAIPAQGRNILLLTHSGYLSSLGQKLEGEVLREYLEGKKRKVLPEEERQANLESLIGAGVSLQQADKLLSGEIVGVVRLSPKEAEGLTHLDAFKLLLANQPEDQRFLALVFCGWQVDSEEPTPDSVWYAWSRYILLIKPQG